MLHKIESVQIQLICIRLQMFMFTPDVLTWNKITSKANFFILKIISLLNSSTKNLLKTEYSGDKSSKTELAISKVESRKKVKNLC